jgi:hypothetical protein
LGATKFGHLCLEAIHQAADLLDFGGAADHRGFFDFGPGWRQLRGAQFHASFLDQFANPNLFGGIVFLVEIVGIALPTGGFAQVGPAADLVGGALVEARIDEALDQSDGMAPALLPVLRESFQHEFHEAADQVGVMA